MVQRSIEQLVKEIEAKRDRLEPLAVEADGLGTAPPELVALLRELRVSMVKVPAELGGDELSFADQLRYFEALSNANPTAAWCGFNHAGVASIAATKLPAAGLATVFGDDPAPLFAGVSAPTGTFRSTDDGIVVSGTWRYASGVRHADWVLVTAVEAETETPGVRLAVVPTANADINGDWEVMALKGTGSINATLHDVAVPDALTVDPLTDRQRGGPMYSVGYPAYVVGENLGFTLGACQRFLDELAVYATAKARGFDGRLADRGAFQYEFGKGSLAVDSCRSYALHLLGETDAKLQGEGRLEPDSEAVIVAMGAYCTETAVNAISHLFHFAGAGALFESSILQRCFRDAHGSVQHLVASNVAYDKHGASILAGAGA